MILMSGKEVAKAREGQLAQEILRFSKASGRAPGLAVVLVGDDPASRVYVGSKEKACAKVGIKSWRIDLKSATTSAELLKVIADLNKNPEVDGILIQSPLPKPLDYFEVIEDLDPMKDVDGFTAENVGLLSLGRKRVAACTPQGVIHLLKHYGVEMKGKNAVVVGRSFIVGKPMAQLLLDENATVTVCHSQTPNIQEFTSRADIVVVAAGKAGLFGKDDFKKDSVVVDVGIHRKPDGNLCGDVRFEELDGWVKAATPVPGGVGPMTIATLLENTVKLATLRF